MPTYKNTGKRPVPFFLRLYQNDGFFRNIVVTLSPGEEKPLSFALPDYAAKGIELIDADFPKLPDPIIVDNVSNYPAGVSREFTIRPCDRYLAQIFVHSGTVRVRFGKTGTPFLINSELAQTFIKKIDWESAPVIIIEGAYGTGLAGVSGTGSAGCVLHVEELQSGEFGGYIDGKVY